MRNLTTVEIVTNEALDLVGTPYIWGGNCPYFDEGVDCSGYVCHLLRSGGIIGDKDYTAAMLFNHLRTKADIITDGDYSAGDLIFWKNRAGNKIVHVEFILNEKLMVGASGGNGNCRTVEDAKEMNAYVKIHPIDSRKYGIVLNTSVLF